MLLEDRLLFELVLVDSQDERVTLAIGREVVFAHDHLAAEEAAGAHDESGDATAGGVDEHPSHRARVVPVAGPNLGVQLHAHVTPPSPVSSGRSAGPVPASTERRRCRRAARRSPAPDPRCRAVLP